MLISGTELEQGEEGQEMGKGGSHSLSGAVILEHLAAWPDKKGSSPKKCENVTNFHFLGLSI